MEMEVAMRSSWCSKPLFGFLFLICGISAIGQQPFNIAIPDTFYSSWGFDILVEDSAIVLTSRVDPNGVDEFIQRITKHDLDGSIKWTSLLMNKTVKSFGIPHDNNIIKTPSGYLIISNAKDTTYYFNPTLAFLDIVGTELRQINLTDTLGTKPFIMSSVVKPDGNIILVCIHQQGATQAARPQFIEIDTSGSVLNSYTHFTSTYRIPVSMDYHEGKLFVCGYRGEASGSDKDAWVAVYDTQYNLLFETSLGDPEIFNSSESIVATPDGGFMVSYVADSLAYTGSYHSYFVKYDSSYQEEWRRQLPLSGTSIIRDLTLLRDSTVLFGGEYDDYPNHPSVGYIGKIDLSAKIMWIRLHTLDPTTLYEIIKVGKELPSGHLVFTGYTFPDHPSNIITSDTWLFMTDANGCIVPSKCDSIPLGVEREMSVHSSLTLFPNPAGAYLHLSLPASELPATYTLYNMTGRMEASGQIESVLQTVNTGHLASGLYVVVVEQEGRRIATGKFVKQ